MAGFRSEAWEALYASRSRVVQAANKTAGLHQCAGATALHATGFGCKPLLKVRGVLAQCDVDRP